MFQIYTDGATSKNGDINAVGGWAYIILKDGIEIGSAADYVKPATNNICEMLAILNACNSIKKELNDIDSVEVYSDSAYCINCVNQHWYSKWVTNGWITSSKEPVKNKELWEQLIPFFEDARFKWIKVKGHSNDKWNEKVDNMAVQARLRIK